MLSWAHISAVKAVCLVGQLLSLLLLREKKDVVVLLLPTGF